MQVKFYLNKNVRKFLFVYISLKTSSLQLCSISCFSSGRSRLTCSGAVSQQCFLPQSLGMVNAAKRVVKEGAAPIR